MFGFGRRRGACVACGSLFFPPFMGRLGAFVGCGRGQIGGRRRGVGVEVWFAGCAEWGGARGTVCWMVGGYGISGTGLGLLGTGRRGWFGDGRGI